MPYYIEKDNEACKSGWAVTGDTGVVHGCHTTKASAIKQAVAISISTDEPFEGERAAVDLLEIGDFVSWDVLDPEILAVIVAVENEMAVIQLYDEEDGVFEPTDKLLVINVFKIDRVPRPELTTEKLDEAPDSMVEDLPVAENSFLSRAKAIIARIDANKESDSMTETVMDEARAKWLRAAYAIKARIEGSEGRALGKTEVRTNHIEMRATGDGRTFEGYASVFDQPSEPLPFIEYVKPGAFKRSLQSRNRMMLLWNHDSSNPLASTRNGSLQLTEDNIGLKVTATLPDTTLGRDIAELVRTGVIDSMSFGFSVKRDSWSKDGQTRYLEDVTLFEVSLVSTPAYEGTAGTVSVRSGDVISADALADALMRIESGEELNPEQGALVAGVIGKLVKTPEVEAVNGDILALKQKKLQLLMKEAI